MRGGVLPPCQPLVALAVLNSALCVISSAYAPLPPLC